MSGTAPAPSRLRIALLVLLAVPGVAPHAARGTDGRPASYDAFVALEPGASLAKALAAHRHVYLRPGVHRVDNPLVVSRDEPLFLHGADRVHTRLVPRHPEHPLFVLEKAPHVNLAGLRLEAPQRDGPPGFVAVLARNREPLQLELQDCSVAESALVLQGPGDVRLQGSVFLPRGAVQSTVVVDHPDARVVLVGGNISNAGRPPRLPGDALFHVWVRRGHLRVFGTGVQAGNGIADFRIDAASRHGPHVIANVRSEGNNGARRGTFPSTLVHVPPTSQPVDLVLLSNGGSWAGQGRGRGRFVDYHATGSVWLAGNNGALGAGALVSGNAPKATLVAVGNLVFDEAGAFPESTKRVFARANLHSYRHRTRIPIPPGTRFLADRSPGPKAALPSFPLVEVPPPLPRPRLTRALPGMLSVGDFGARGDGEHDDTRAIQAALDAGCDGKTPKLLHLPAGTYRVTDVLRLNHRKARCTRHPSGGWIAGAGSDRTVVRRDGSGGVFATQGLAYATVQGITFRTAPGTQGPAPGGEAAFALENAQGVGHASQEVSFYDVVFDGGAYGLGIGLESGAQCSENLMVDVAFRNAGHGLAIGSYNALANLVYRGRFVDNRISMGHAEGALSGGTWAVLGATVRGTRERDLSVRNSASGVWYFHALDSTSPVLVTTTMTGAGFPLVFDRLRLAPPEAASPQPLVDFSAAGGPIFLNSAIERGSLRLTGGLASNSAVAIGSRIPGWKASQARGSSRLVVLDGPP